MEVNKEMRNGTVPVKEMRGERLQHDNQVRWSNDEGEVGKEREKKVCIRVKNRDVTGH